MGKFVEEGADSLFSAARNFRLFWAQNSDLLRPMNYDVRKRKMEQDMSIQYQENGSIYITKTAALRKHQNRLTGKIAVYEMDEWSSFQIDTHEHVEIVQWIMGKLPIHWPKTLTTAIFDFDGVMTDDRVWVREDGVEMIACNRGDGLGIERMNKRGVEMMVLSKEKNPCVAARCKKLNIPCHQGVNDKGDFLRKWLSDKDIQDSQVAYLGNDINDLPCLKIVGFPVCVANAHPDVMLASHTVLSSKGGDGAVREFCDKFLSAKGE